MKSGFFFIALLFLSCSSGRQSQFTLHPVNEAAFSRVQAERILGVPVSAPEIRDDGCIIYDMSWHFHERDLDSFSGKATVGAMVNVGEDSSPVAKWYLSDIQKWGVVASQRVIGVGDEAYLWGSVSEWRMKVRKGKYEIWFRVRPTSLSTTDEFVRVAAEIVAAL